MSSPYESSLDADAARWDSYGERVTQSIIDDILDGHKVGLDTSQRTAASFLDEPGDWLAADDLAAIVTRADRAEEVVTRLRLRLAETVREWCEESASGQDAVQGRIDALQEDAQTNWRDE